MIGIIVTMCLISVILPFVFKVDNSFDDGDGKIVFGFSKRIRLVMFICMLVFVIALFVMGGYVILNNSNNGEVVGVVIFFLFSLCGCLGYLFVRNKYFVYYNEELHCYNVWGKESAFKIVDIKEVVEYPSNGMVIVFKDGKRVKADSLMSNYNKMKEIFDSNGIVFRDKNGNNAPKGW